MSIRELISPTSNYKAAKAPVTPYEAAEGIWDRKIGSARVQAYNWRLMALGLLAACLCLVASLVFMSTKSSVTPYVVEVGPDGARAVGLATAEKYIPKDQEIKYFLNQFILKTRTIPTDAVVSKQNWTAAFAMLRPAAAEKLTSIVKKENPVGRIGRETAQVNVLVIVPVSKNTWQIRWGEDIYNAGGGLKEAYKMTGLFTLEFGTPSTEKELVSNPLGMYITDFSWSREM